jgi:hypothetical protein
VPGWVKLELAKKPLPCLEYIVVHELVHLLERHHDERFTALMDAPAAVAAGSGNGQHHATGA